MHSPSISTNVVVQLRSNLMFKEERHGQIKTTLCPRKAMARFLGSEFLL